MRAFDDFAGARQALYDNVLTATKAIKPVELQGRKIELVDSFYDPSDDDDEDAEKFSPAAQAKAIHTQQTLGRRLRGVFRMTDTNTGKVEDYPTTLAVVPRFNDDGTMIYRGSRYAVINQQRLKPGIFTRVKKNADLEAYINADKTTGLMHRLIFRPDKSTFLVNVGSSNVPLASMLRTLGVTDDQMKEAWGDEIAAKNIAAIGSQDVSKLYDRLVRGKDKIKDATPEQKQQLLAKAITSIGIDPWVSKRNLGIDTDRLTPEAIMRSTQKTLEMSRENKQGDDRDSLANQSVMSVEDFFGERIKLDSGFHQRNNFRNALYRGDPKVLPTKVLQKQLEDVLFGSGVAVQPDNANPLQAWDLATRITKMGQGAIGSTTAVPMEARDFHSSHLGFIDPARSVECGPGYMEVMTNKGWVRLDNLTAEHEIACLIDGRVEYHKPTKVQSYDYVGDLCGFKSYTAAYEVTPNHRMWVACAHAGSEFRFETASDIVSKQRIVLCGGHAPYRGRLDSLKKIASPIHEDAGHQAFKLPEFFNIEDWAEFLGWFLSEGSTGGDSYRGGRNSVSISQSKDTNIDNWYRIDALLKRMGIKYCAADKGFTISNTHLASYCDVFGKCDAKYTPTDVFEYPVEARRRFYEAMCLGDGGRRKDNKDDTSVFYSTSSDLAMDIQQIAFDLGISTSCSVRQDNREERYLDVYRVHIHTRTRRKIGTTKIDEGGHYVKPYAGKVYCATVPGGLMYWRMPEYGGFWIGNSLKVGVDLNLAAQARKGSDGKIYTPLVNAKTGQLEYKSPEDIADLAIAPQSSQDIEGYMTAIKAGEEDYYKPEEVDYILPDAESGFSGVADLIPMKMMQPQNRTAMGSRFLVQAIPLKNREAPLVQSAVPGTDKSLSFYRLYNSRAGVVSSKGPGTVQAVAKDRIVVSHPQEDGSQLKKTYWLHENTPIGPKTALSNTARVKPGDVVDQDTVLASSNYATDDGDIAIGLNAKMALMPWGDNYEDAYVISESFAKRLTSVQSYDYTAKQSKSDVNGVKKFISVLPTVFDKSQVGKLSEDGIIQVGQQVKKGDPLILSAVLKDPNMSKPLSKSGHRAFKDQSQVWEHEDDGLITGVHKDQRGNIFVSVQTESPTVDADKISEIFGTKGVVKVIADDKMLQDSDGKPLDVVASDLGLISRQNSSRAYAMLLGKVAQKTGKPYLLEESDTLQDLAALTKQELAKHGLSDVETVIDPKNGRHIPNVLVGPQYVMKLTHLAESKAQARSTGLYASDGTPAKGSEEGQQAKRVSNQELGALVSHGAMNYLQEISTVKGSRNDEWIARYMSGKDLPQPTVPFVYEKFLGYMQGLGVNPVRTGSKTRLYVMTDDGIDDLTGNRKVRSSQTVNLAKNMKPIEGGLFDPAIFGDDGKKFARYEFATAIPHPMMQKPLQKLIGLTEKQFRETISGEHEIKGHGTGVEAIASWLKALDINKEKGIARQRISTGARTTKDKEIQRLNYLSAIEKHGISPEKIMLTKLPIIPPVYRPVSKLDDNNVPLVDGMNMLYQQMIDADSNVRGIRKFSSDDGKERLALYDAVQAVVGLEDPADPELKQKQVKGIMKRLVGSSPKQSYVQSKLLSGTVDSVARAVVIPSSDLKLDEIGVPEHQAWELYRMPLMRQLTRRGIPVARAKQEIDDHSSMAREALLREMEDRPVTTSRAPVLHKYGMLGFKAKLVPGHALQVNPLVHVGLGLDHDGDQMNFHAVITDEAVKEVKQKMFPSKNLIAASDFKSPNNVPRQDHGLGLYLASTAKQDRPTAVFKDIASAVQAFGRSEINIDTPVKILE